MSYMAHPLPKGPGMTTRTSLRFVSLALALTLAGVAGGCAASSDDDLLDEEGEASSLATMELWSTSGRWYFHLVSGNGNVLLSSEAYTDRTGALNGVLSVLDNGAYTESYVAIAGSSGKYHLNLNAANGQVIATTQEYSTKSSATRAIGSCTRAVAGYLAAWNTMTAARAQVSASDVGFHFNIHAANGETLLTSESYTTEAAALNGAFSVVDNGTNAALYEVRQSQSGSYYFVLKATNGQVIGTSQQYSSKYNAERGRDAMIALVPSIKLL